MKIKLLFIGFLLLNFNSVFGQSFCSTPPTSSNLSLNSSFQMRGTNNSIYCLKVYFHVIRRSNGTGGQTLSSVNEAFSILNQDFNPHNISFNWDNQIDYIDNDSYYGTPSTAIFNVNNHLDGIDIYLFDDSSSSGGRANGVGNSSEFWVSGSYWKPPYNSLTISNVISHEMGHVLFLWHTHHGTYNEWGSDTSQCAELVNGLNSASCGDYVTDTPADPHLEFNVNQSTCRWNGSGKDSNGESYKPDEKNLMSYTDVNCMEYFTQGQGQRMRNAISTLPYLQQTVTSNCSVTAVITGDSLICYDGNKIYNITDLGSNFTWQVSSNLQVISSNTTSITITPISNSTRGMGYIKAILPNQIIEKVVWVGTPLLNYDMNEDFTMCKDINTTTNNFFSVSIEGMDASTTWEVQRITTNHSVSMQGNEVLVSLDHAPPYNYIAFKVRASNTCGFSNWLEYYVELIEYCDYYRGYNSFIVYPNPASEIVNIRAKKSSEEINTEIPYQIYDFNGTLIEKGNFKNQKTIDLSNYKNGNFILKIDKGSNSETHQIIIK